MILEKSNLGFTVIPGITRLTPEFSGISARLTNGTRFGVNGLGDATLDNIADWSLTDILTAIQRGMIALNAQQVFQINLDRLQRGLPAIPTQFAAPTVNFGIEGVSPSMLMIGAGLLLLLLLRR